MGRKRNTGSPTLTPLLPQHAGAARVPSKCPCVPQALPRAPAEEALPAPRCQDPAAPGDSGDLSCSGPAWRALSLT